MSDEHISHQPLVSIIVPAYNAGAFIEETIASVQEQTYRQWEMLIANDGSTDDTVRIIEQAALRDERIKLFHVPKGKNGLAARARNLAMDQARGELFALLDADDKWYPDKLERQISYLAEHSNVDGVCTWFELFGDPERIKRGRRKHKTPVLITPDEAVTSCPIFTSSFMFRRKCYDETGGMDEDSRLVSGQDYEFFFRLVKAYTLHRIPQVLTFYRVAPLEGSLFSSHVSAQNERGWRLLDVFVEKGLLAGKEITRKKSALYYQQAIQNLFYLNAPFRRYLWRSISTGRPPGNAVIIFLLSFLPAPILWRILMLPQKILGLIRKS